MPTLNHRLLFLLTQNILHGGAIDPSGPAGPSGPSFLSHTYENGRLITSGIGALTPPHFRILGRLGCPKANGCPNAFGPFWALWALGPLGPLGPWALWAQGPPEAEGQLLRGLGGGAPQDSGGPGGKAPRDSPLGDPQLRKKTRGWLAWNGRRPLRRPSNERPTTI